MYQDIGDKMGKDYSEKEYRHLLAMQEKEKTLREMYKKGFSFNKWYLFLIDGNGKFPQWSVCDVNPYENDKVKCYTFNSYKKAIEFINNTKHFNFN